MKKELRDYQLKTIELTKEAMKSGLKKIMIKLPTGSGKTEIFIKNVFDILRKNKRVLVIMRGVDIAHQTRRRMNDALPIPVGFMVSNHTDKNLVSDAVVSSIDTVASKMRRKSTIVVDAEKTPIEEFLKSFDCIIVDEAHDATSNTFQDFFDLISGKYVLGYTATPHYVGRKGHSYWDTCLEPIQGSELRDKGYLVPVDIFIPEVVKMDGVRVTSGDFNSKDLLEKMDTSTVYGDMLRLYKEHSQMKKPALIFSVTVSHSEKTIELFKKAGIHGYHVDANSDKSYRDFVIKEIREHCKAEKPLVVSNVNIFCKGVDIPELSIAIMNRATLSLNLFKQQAGRILRPSEGKGNAVIIDCAGNCLRFGSPYRYHKPDMKDKPKGERNQKEPDESILERRCPHCTVLLDKPMPKCSNCGKEILPSRTVTELKNVNLVKFSEEDAAINLRKEIVGKFYKMKHVYKSKGLNERKIYFVLLNKYGNDFLNHLDDIKCPDRIREELKIEHFGSGVDLDALKRKAEENKKARNEWALNKLNSDMKFS